MAISNKGKLEFDWCSFSVLACYSSNISIKFAKRRDYYTALLFVDRDAGEFVLNKHTYVSDLIRSLYE